MSHPSESPYAAPREPPPRGATVGQARWDGALAAVLYTVAIGTIVICRYMLSS